MGSVGSVAAAAWNYAGASSAVAPPANPQVLKSRTKMISTTDEIAQVGGVAKRSHHSQLAHTCEDFKIRLLCRPVSAADSTIASHCRSAPSAPTASVRSAS